MTISNVGDSRAVLVYQISNDQTMDSTPAEEEKEKIGEKSDSEHVTTNTASFEAGSIMVIPLSEDQILYLKDERGCLKKPVHKSAASIKWRALHICTRTGVKSTSVLVLTKNAILREFGVRMTIYSSSAFTRSLGA